MDEVLLELEEFRNKLEKEIEDHADTKLKADEYLLHKNDASEELERLSSFTRFQ